MRLSPTEAEQSIIESDWLVLYSENTISVLPTLYDYWSFSLPDASLHAQLLPQIIDLIRPTLFFPAIRIINYQLTIPPA